MKRNKNNELIKNTLFSMKDLLDGKDDYIMIPDYQRGFAWDDEFITLLDDIKNFRLNISKNNKQYYLSMITINECNDDAIKRDENLSGKNLFYIVDGQQRITSLIIIIVTMIKMIEKEDKSFPKLDEYKEILKLNSNKYSFLYSNQREDASKDFFVDYVYKDDKSVLAKDKYSSYIKKACNELQERLNKLDIKEIEEILVDIVENFVFTVYYIEGDKFDVRISFETMNNRGKQLSNLEKLKNRLLYLTQYITNDNDSMELRDNINKNWAIIYDNLSNRDKILSDDDFLRAHYFIYFRVDKETSNKYFSDLMNDIFSFDYKSKFRKLAEDKKYNYINDYLDDLKKYSKYFKLVSFCDSSDLNISDNEMSWLKRFRRLETSLYLKSFLMFFMNTVDNETERIKFYEKLEKYIFIKKYICYKGNTSLSIDPLINSLRSSGANCLGELYKKIELSPKDVQEYFSSFLEKFTDIEKCKNLFYDWNYGLRYFLFEYNESIASVKDNSSGIDWDKLERTSIEHILPQNPKTEYWKTAFNKYINNEKRLKTITNLLGNFVLLKNASQNSKLSNFSYPIKRGIDLDQTKDAKRFSYSDGSKSQKLLAQVKKYQYWTSKQIYERTDELLNFLYEHWLKEYISGKDKNVIFSQYQKRLGLKPENDYETIYEKLDKIDLTQEKEEAYRHCDTNILNEDERVTKFREYFSLNSEDDRNKWTINQSQLRYKEKRFVGKYIKEDEIFIFAYKINKEKITLKYSFNDNTMVIEGADDKNQELKKFLDGFDRYLVRSGLQSNTSIKTCYDVKA